MAALTTTNPQSINRKIKVKLDRKVQFLEKLKIFHKKKTFFSNIKFQSKRCQVSTNMTGSLMDKVVTK